MRKTICQLSAWETKAWEKEKQKPDCHRHPHVSEVDACEMTGHDEIGSYRVAIARWVGPKQITLTAGRRKWRVMNQTGPSGPGAPVMQFVEGAPAVPSRRRSPRNFRPHGLPTLRDRKGSQTRRSRVFSLPPPMDRAAEGKESEENEASA